MQKTIKHLFSKTNLSILTMLITLISLNLKADLTIYSDRTTANLKPLTDAFTQRTGQNIQIVELAYPAIKARITAEGESTPVDLIFTKDLIYLNELTQMGWLQKFTSESALQNVPEQMRHSENLWVAMSYRARTLIYNSTVTDASTINDYKDLANPEWAGRLCVRTSNHPYNQALISNFIHILGAEATKTILSGFVANFAQDPLASDRAVIDAVAQGQCDVGLVNHYYLAPYVDANPAFVVQPKFLSLGGQGVHTNGSGLGIYKDSKNVEIANQFIDFMLEDANQLAWSKGHFDYPVKRSLIPSTVIEKWGPFNINLSKWQDLSPLLPEALSIINEVQYK